MNYPTEFSTELINARELGLPAWGEGAIDTLAKEGLEVVIGLRECDVPDLTKLASCPEIVEFCPNDATKRFGSIEQAHNWVSKGRNTLQLRESDSQVMAGFGWTGPGTCPQVPDGDTTFAERLSPVFSGRGLAKPFNATILAINLAMHGTNRVWLETWASNTAAVRTYLSNRAELITTKDAFRPTLRPAANESDGMRRDVRLFMQFPRRES